MGVETGHAWHQLILERSTMQTGYDIEVAGGDATPSETAVQGPGPVINDAIGRALQTHYRVLTEEPLPSRFLVLLAELEAKEARLD